MSKQQSTSVPAERAQNQRKPSTPTTPNGDNRTRDTNKERRPRREQTEGTSRPRGRYNGSRPSPHPDARILYVGRVYIDKLDEDQAKNKKYNEERLRLLKEVLQKYGDLEKLETFDNESFVFAYFKEHAGAQAALDNLNNRNTRQQVCDEILAKLKEQNLPENVCPPIWKYKIEWTNKDAATGRPYANGNVRENKPTPTTPVDGAQDVKQKKRAPKKAASNDDNVESEVPKVKKERQTKKHENTTTETAAKPQPAEPVRSNTTTHSNTVVRNLQAEAERAHLRRERDYLEHQRASFLKEIEFETGRYKDRDARIKRLQGDHSDIQRKVSDLQEKLNKEVTLESSAKLRMQEMSEEIKHTQQQEAVVLEMLKNVEAFAAAALSQQKKQ